MKHLTEDYLLSHHFIHFVSAIHRKVNVVDEKLILESISSSESLLAVYLCVLGSKAAYFRIWRRARVHFTRHMLAFGTYWSSHELRGASSRGNEKYRRHVRPCEDGRVLITEQKLGPGVAQAKFMH